MALMEVDAGSLMNLLGIVPVLRIWRNECHKAHLAAEGEQFGDFGDSSYILRSVLRSKAQILIKAGSNDIAVQNEDFAAVTEHLI